MADKDLITTEDIVRHFSFNPTTAKRYLRQLTEFGYLEAHGGNKNRTSASSMQKQQSNMVEVPLCDVLGIRWAHSRMQGEGSLYRNLEISQSSTSPI